MQLFSMFLEQKMNSRVWTIIEGRGGEKRGVFHANTESKFFSDYEDFRWGWDCFSHLGEDKKFSTIILLLSRSVIQKYFRV